jgi:hypothetical protein
MRSKAGLIGVVSVIDVTYSVNGWHFDVHAIVFAKTDLQLVKENTMLPIQVDLYRLPIYTSSLIIVPRRDKTNPKSQPI